MGMTWTPEQKAVIDLRERNILVSAAAGSGKNLPFWWADCRDADGCRTSH